MELSLFYHAILFANIKYFFLNISSIIAVLLINSQMDELSFILARTSNIHRWYLLYLCYNDSNWLKNDIEHWGWPNHVVETSIIGDWHKYILLHTYNYVGILIGTLFI